MAASEGDAMPRAGALALRAVWRRRTVYLEAALATVVVNLLTLCSALFSMQVFDRVIPNQGFQTLWVLTVGVAVAIGLELLLKHVRANSVERANTAVDHELSSWLFGRLLGIRMEKRPDSIGSLAAQIKGFETVRGVLTSTSLFVLADVPFALLFIAVIGLLGGWLVVVPLIALPLALIAGLAFQRAILGLSARQLAASNRKTGLLVEGIDAAESLKAVGAEAGVRARWDRLVAEAGEVEQSLREYSAVSQHLTVALQQLAYVSLIALGAYLAVENRLSMGALLACSIISNRALMPIVQLPGVMVQWAHARAALDALNALLALPNETDEKAQGLAPGVLEPSCRFERVRYSHGRSSVIALELPAFSVQPGERVGILGAVGSGKSTLLKLASGIYRPNEGQVFLGGIDAALLAPEARRGLVGYLPQDCTLVSGTLRENLLHGLPDSGDERILAAARATGLIDLINSQPRGLALEITEGGRGVSGGQRQSIALTRLALADARLWVLDEPTGAMDAVTEAKCIELFRTAAARGATLLVATHKNALLSLFDRLIVLQGGRVVVDGPREAVYARLSAPREPAREPVKEQAA
jgi:ATP-binding cassette, subfamily C, bacterial LapB